MSRDPDDISIEILGGALVSNPTISLTFGAYSVTLPSPEFNNVDSFYCQRSRVTNRSGGTYYLRDTQWPRNRIQKYIIDKVTQTQKDDFMELVQVSLGQIVRLVDHEGTAWDIIILNPESVVSESLEDIFQISVEFIGEQV